VTEAGLVVAGKGPEISAHQASYVEFVYVADLALVLRLAGRRGGDELPEELVQVGAVMEGSKRTN